MANEESDLYGLPLEEFIAARTELERRLRKDGQRERAAAVKKLPKPSVAAWAVNQASRTQPNDRRELLAASSALREAQERLIAGDASAADLEQAATRQRAAIEALVDAASGLLSGDGKPLGDATLARVRETFAAVAADEEVAALVEAGTLDRERRPAGLGFGFGLGGLAAEPAEPEPSRAAKPSSAGKKGGRKEAGGGAAAPKGGKEAAPKGGKAAAQKSAAKEKREREQTAKRRRRELEAARERAKAAKAAEREAEKRQKAAAKDARAAAKALERAEAAADEARERADAARAALESATATRDEAVLAREAADAEATEAAEAHAAGD